MKTDDLIGMLAGGAPAVETDSFRRRYVTALGWGAFGTLLLMTIWLGVRRDVAMLRCCRCSGSNLLFLPRCSQVR